jgi:hypothetical protein
LSAGLLGGAEEATTTVGYKRIFDTNWTNKNEQNISGATTGNLHAISSFLFVQFVFRFVDTVP